MMTYYHDEKEYDNINFRVIPFEFVGETMYALVEEKRLGTKVMADIRRHLDETQFKSLRDAVNAC